MTETPIFISPDSAGVQPAPPRKRLLLKWSLLATGLLLAYAMWQCGSGLVQGARFSDAAAAEFHRELNAAQFEEICARADPAFRTAEKKEELIKFLTAVHKKLGNAGKADRGNVNVNTNTSGTFVTVSYTTTYERGSAVETFTWKKSITGELKLIGYNIQSNAFILQ